MLSQQKQVYKYKRLLYVQLMRKTVVLNMYGFYAIDVCMMEYFLFATNGFNPHKLEKFAQQEAKITEIMCVRVCLFRERGEI